MEELIQSLTPEQIDLLTQLTNQTNTWLEAHSGFVLAVFICLLIWQWRLFAAFGAVWFLFNVFNTAA